MSRHGPFADPVFTTQFLANYWQKQPVCFRQAFPDFSNFIAKSALFSLSRQDNVESRLVLEKHGEYAWQVINGPLTDIDFSALPGKHWTLLVQNLELHIPEAARFLATFDFIPNWRIDDLMVSYATDLGGVGPHRDNYDVFLFQAEGRRRWSVSTRPYGDSDLVEGLDLQMLKNFRGEQEWLLEKGDMLYLPPGIAHHGVALEEGMTFSVGFRAPSRHELVECYLEHLLENETDTRLSDAGRSPCTHPGELSAEDIARVQCLFLTPVDMDIALARYCSRLPESFIARAPAQALSRDDFYQHYRYIPELTKHATRSVFVRKPGKLLLFVNGDAITLPDDCTAFVEQFSSADTFANPFYQDR